MSFWATAAVSLLPANQPSTPVLPIRLHLQAIDSARNIAHRYAIEAGADLFGHIIVDLHWGRIGTKGQSRTLSFAQAQNATRFVRRTLNRRASAKKRLGVGYEPRAYPAKAQPLNG